jgi:hypothetical protein
MVIKYLDILHSSMFNYHHSIKLFWDITQRCVIILYRRFGTTYGSNIQRSRSPRNKLSSWVSWPLNLEPKVHPETSVGDYHSTLRNIPEERGSHLYRGRSLKSRTTQSALWYVLSFFQSVRFRPYAFNFQYLFVFLRSSCSCVCLLPRLPVSSTFSSITCFRKQFLCKMWPIQLDFLHFTVRRVFLYALTLCNASSFLTRSVKLTFCILLQHHISKLSRYFWPTFRKAQVSAPHKDMLQP